LHHVARTVRQRFSRQALFPVFPGSLQSSVECCNFGHSPKIWNLLPRVLTGIDKRERDRYHVRELCPRGTLYMWRTSKFVAMFFVLLGAVGFVMTAQAQDPCDCYQPELVQAGTIELHCFLCPNVGEDQACLYVVTSWIVQPKKYNPYYADTQHWVSQWRRETCYLTEDNCYSIGDPICPEISDHTFYTSYFPCIIPCP
jgi:hypothetical protein